MAAIGAPPVAAPPDVPILRDDLDLLPTTPDDDGAPAYLLHDPLAGRFHRLGADEVDLLGLIGAGDAATVARLSQTLPGEPFSEGDVATFFAYLRRNHLVHGDDRQRAMFLHHSATRPGWLAKLVKSYLSVRIPLVRPDLFLTRTLPHVRWLAAPATLWVIALLGGCGLFLASRQLDVFLNTFADFLNWQGALAMAVTLGVVKVLHEFGHAYTAKAFGLPLPMRCGCTGWSCIWASPYWSIIWPSRRWASCCSSLNSAILSPCRSHGKCWPGSATRRRFA